MSNERIDLTQFEEIEARIKQCQKGFYPAEDLLQELAHHAPSLLAELKRMYESEDRLLELLQEIEYRYEVPVKQIAALMSI